MKRKGIPRRAKRILALLLAALMMGNISALAADERKPGPEDLEEDPGRWVQLSCVHDYGDRLTGREYCYNEDERVTKITWHTVNQDGTEQWTEEIRILDDDGLISGSETRDLETGELVETKVWFYTPDEQLKQIRTYDWSGFLKSEQNNSYSADTITTEIVHYDDNGNIYSRTVIEDDLDHNPLQTASFDRHDVCINRTETIYSSDGAKEREIQYNSFGEAWLTLEYSNTYDEDGRLTEARCVYVGSILDGNERVIRYTYDDFGNLIEESSVYNGEKEYTERSRWGLLKDGQIVRVSE